MGSIRDRSKRAAIAYLLATATATATAALALSAIAVPAAVAQPLMWSRAAAIPSLSHAAGSETESQLLGVSCPQSGSCAAVGFAGEHGVEVALFAGLEPISPLVASAKLQPFVVTEHNGAWAAASTPALPEGAEVDKALLMSLSCTAPGECVAVGEYEPKGTNEELPFAAFEVGGEWSRADAVPLPGNAERGEKQHALLQSVSCVAAGDCTAVGGYEAEGEVFEGMAISESAGAWGPATEIAGSASHTFLRSVSCTGGGSCTAVGYGQGSSPADPTSALAVSESAGVWGPSVEVAPLPSAAEAGQLLESVSCVAPGSCVAVGGDQLKSEGKNEVLPIAVEQTGGTWGPAQKVTSPQGGGEKEFALLVSVSCPSAGSCAAGGLDVVPLERGSVRYGAVTASDDGGEWSLEEPQLPPEASSLLSAASSVSCAPAGSCLGTGFYTKSNATPEVEPMSLTAIVKLEASAPSLPAGAVGVPYHGQLSATGGTGVREWSIKSGSLPAGLTLDPSTGAISGTPTQAGASAFVAQVVDPGPPSQSADVTASLAIAAPGQVPVEVVRTEVVHEVLAKPDVRILGKNATAQHDHLKVKLACSEAACSGSARVVETVVKKVRRKGHVRRERRHVLLAKGSYAIAAGKHELVALHLTRAGKRVIASIERQARRERRHHRHAHAKPLKAKLSVTVSGGNSATRIVRIG